MTKPTKCECSVGYSIKSSYHNHVIRCDWCKKRDEVWNEMWDGLISAACIEENRRKHDEFWTELYARAKELT